MSLQFKAAAPPESDEESLDLEEDEVAAKRIKLIRDLRESDLKTKFAGGIKVSLDSEAKAYSTSASLSAEEKKGLKEVEELERELDLKNTFSRETNRRDEDAEMNKYIEEQIRLRRQAAKKDRESKLPDGKGPSDDDDISDLQLNMGSAADNVDEILLETLSKSYSSTIDEKSESMLSSQMLNGIPEVDLGLNEKIRTIEATEEAKLRLASGSSRDRTHRASKRPGVPGNFSCNFQSHRGSRDKSGSDAKSLSGQNRGPSHHHQQNQKPETKIEPVVDVGEEPREIEVRLPSSATGNRKPPPRGRATDDYFLQRYKQNNRR